MSNKNLFTMQEIDESLFDENTGLTDVENDVMFDIPVDNDNSFFVEEEEVESVCITINAQDCINIANNVFSRHPEIVSHISNNIDTVLMFLQDEYAKESGLYVDFTTMMEDKDFSFFMYAVGCGVICGVNYENVIPCTYKLVYYPEDPNKCLNVNYSNIGYIYKSYPIITHISTVEFNAVFAKIYSKVEIPNEYNGDYAKYYIQYFDNKPVYDELDELNVEFYSNMEIAELIAGGNQNVLEATKNLSKSRVDSVVILLQAMKDNRG